jgi:hypothetical protein
MIWITNRLKGESSLPLWKKDLLCWVGTYSGLAETEEGVLMIHTLLSGNSCSAYKKTVKSNKRAKMTKAKAALNP